MTDDIRDRASRRGLARAYALGAMTAVATAAASRLGTDDRESTVAEIRRIEDKLHGELDAIWGEEQSEIDAEIEERWPTVTS